MISEIVAKLTDLHFLESLLVAIAASATVITLAIPLMETDSLGRRMKSVSVERERIRLREREKLAANSGKSQLRLTTKASLLSIVRRFNLAKWMGTDTARTQLAMAGFRGAQSEPTFLVARMAVPIVVFLVSGFVIFFLGVLHYSTLVKLFIVLLATFLGMKLPEIYLKNIIGKRQMSIRRAFPDALDLLLICVESGMSIEHAFRKVAIEVGAQSIPMAEELTLTTAELSYLPDRRTAYENLGIRTGLDSVRAICTVLIQAEKYGTPLGTALRVVSQESRDTRMMEAEKKAAALPPKLTVPMILFFLPVLFAVIITPAVIQVRQQLHY